MNYFQMVTLTLFDYFSFSARTFNGLCKEKQKSFLSKERAEVNIKLFLVACIVFLSTALSAENQSEDLELVFNHPDVHKLGQLPQSRILSVVPVNQGLRDYVINFRDNIRGVKCNVLVKIILRCGTKGCISEIQSVSAPSCY